MPCISQEQTSQKSRESGLHIECEGSRLHLNRVSENTRWHIADGFKAWSTLRLEGIGQYPRMDGPQKRHSDSPQLSKVGNERCPFAAQHGVVSRKNLSAKGGLLGSDDARSDNVAEDPIAAEARSAKVASNHPSQTGSATSKCPIRFLDQHSPEEIAEYFKNHSHELPRSHEICVKRYQRNEDQIKQLDHKYGSLVNMIQGLGQKHQPMLHLKMDGEDASQSQAKVEAWTKNVDQDKETRVDDSNTRDGHFDRPLKEIRVGESPSRPWGISVPHAAHIPPSAVSCQEDADDPPQPELPTPSSLPERGRTRSPLRMFKQPDGQQKMVFTGPVFIGYPPEQVTNLLQRTDFGRDHGQ